MEQEKTCIECGVRKDLGFFKNQKKGVGGKTAMCKACISKKRKVSLMEKRGIIFQEHRTLREIIDILNKHDSIVEKGETKGYAAYKLKVSDSIISTWKKKISQIEKYGIESEFYEMTLKSISNHIRNSIKPEEEPKMGEEKKETTIEEKKKTVEDFNLMVESGITKAKAQSILGHTNYSYNKICDDVKRHEEEKKKRTEKPPKKKDPPDFAIKKDDIISEIAKKLDEKIGDNTYRGRLDDVEQRIEDVFESVTKIHGKIDAHYTRQENSIRAITAMLVYFFKEISGYSKDDIIKAIDEQSKEITKTYIHGIAVASISEKTEDYNPVYSVEKRIRLQFKEKYANKPMECVVRLVRHAGKNGITKSGLSSGLSTIMSSSERDSILETLSQIDEKFQFKLTKNRQGQIIPIYFYSGDYHDNSQIRHRNPKIQARHLAF